MGIEPSERRPFHSKTRVIKGLQVYIYIYIYCNGGVRSFSSIPAVPFFWGGSICWMFLSRKIPGLHVHVFRGIIDFHMNGKLMNIPRSKLWPTIS